MRSCTGNLRAGLESDFMSAAFNVLHIDDNSDDRVLVARELRKEFPAICIREVTDQQTFDQALLSDDVQLIITDYHLFWTDGLSILKTLKTRWPDRPVIMFTGTGSEEIAVEAMKGGLDDYVLKSSRHYSRLLQAVRIALRVSSHKHELRQAENRYKVLFDSVPVGLYRTTPKGEILDANPALVEMLKYPDAQELLRTRASVVYADAADYERWRSRIERDGLIQNFEVKLRRFDGTVCWGQDSAKAIRDPVTGEIFYEGSLEDITLRKAAEDEREKLIQELQEALAKIKTLGGLLPICASCKKIRDDKGYWNQIEFFIQSHSDAEFTHSFCPDCMRQLYPEVFEQKTTKA